MPKLDLGNLDSIIENLKTSEENVTNILEEQSSTIFHTRDYYEGELKVYKDVITMLVIYQEKKRKE